MQMREPALNSTKGSHALRGCATLGVERGGNHLVSSKGSLLSRIAEGQYLTSPGQATCDMEIMRQECATP